MFIYIYMSWVPGFTVPPPPHGLGTQDGLPMRVEYACHAAYACICSHMHTYAPAYPHLHMHAWHMQKGICMHGMHAPTYAYACMACMHICMPHPMCTSNPHPPGCGGSTTIGGALPRWIL